MAFLYHQRLINKIRSFLSTILTSYDPFGDKLVEHFRANPYYPFTCTQAYTFEYKYRRWSTISFLILVQLLLFIVTFYSYLHIRIDEYGKIQSVYVLFLTFTTFTFFLCLNLFENLKQRRIVLSPLDFHVSIYINNHLKQQCSIDRAYICLHQTESYNILLYHLVFIIEDIDFIQITDYFHYQFQLRQIGKCLAENLYLSYIESEHWIGIFPKYRQLKKCLRRQQQSMNEPGHPQRKQLLHPSISTLV